VLSVLPAADLEIRANRRKLLLRRLDGLALPGRIQPAQRSPVPHYLGDQPSGASSRNTAFPSLLQRQLEAAGTSRLEAIAGQAGSLAGGQTAP